jgi:hypothetical protein
MLIPNLPGVGPGFPAGGGTLITIVLSDSVYEEMSCSR